MRSPDGENASARGASPRRTNAGSRRPTGSYSVTPESLATATRSPPRDAATAPPGGMVGAPPGAAGDGDQAAPARRRAAPARRDRMDRRRLIGGRDEQLVLGDDADEMLIRPAKEIARHRRQCLRPRESRAARERNDVPQRVDRVERSIGTQRRLPDVRRDGIDAPAAEIEREQIALRGRDEQKF